MQTLYVMCETWVPILDENFVLPDTIKAVSNEFLMKYHNG